jgi:hypothetical protein
VGERVDDSLVRSSRGATAVLISSEQHFPNSMI